MLGREILSQPTSIVLSPPPLSLAVLLMAIDSSFFFLIQLVQSHAADGNFAALFTYNSPRPTITLNSTYLTFIFQPTSL